jgi:hypothetical protein
MKKLVAISIVTAILTGCYTYDIKPYPVTPSTPIGFLVESNQQDDRSLSCHKISNQYKFNKINEKVLERIFESKAPSLAISPTYTTTYGTATRVGNVIAGNTSSTVYGGGSVMIYDSLTLRARDIVSSIERRSKVLRSLAERRGDCSADDLKDSLSLLDELKRSIASKEKSLENRLVILVSNEKLREAYNPPPQVSLEIKAEEDVFTAKERKEIKQVKAQYELLLQEHQVMYKQAEIEAESKRRWFENNTKMSNNK